MLWSYYPSSLLVWAAPISLATTLGITGLFSSPPGTKMFQFPGFSPHKLCIGLWVTALFNAAGFPHSDTPGSLSVYDSPRRFAVFCVLLLLYMPRHPPYALFRLITTYLAYLCFYENCILRFTLRIDFVLIFSFLQLLRKTYLSFFCYSVFKELLPEKSRRSLKTKQESETHFVRTSCTFRYLFRTSFSLERR
jgi:hypothetical protein